jgi:hypothetical protein
MDIKSKKEKHKLPGTDRSSELIQAGGGTVRFEVH